MDMTASKVEQSIVWPINSNSDDGTSKLSAPLTHAITRQLLRRHVPTLPASRLSGPLLRHHRAACYCDSRISQRPTGRSGWSLVPCFTAPPSLSNPMLLARALLGARQPPSAVAKSLLPRPAVSLQPRQELSGLWAQASLKVTQSSPARQLWEQPRGTAALDGEAALLNPESSGRGIHFLPEYGHGFNTNRWSVLHKI